MQAPRNYLSLLLVILVAGACNSELQVSAEAIRDKAITVNGFDRLSALKDEEIVVIGKNFDSNVQAKIDELPANFKLVSKTEAILTIPSDAPDGLRDVKFTKGTLEIASIPLIVGEVTDEIPFMTTPPSKVCNDIIYKDKTGNLARGQRTCLATLATDTNGKVIPSCSPTQAAPCIVDGIEYNAAEMSGILATNIRSGTTIAGVQGNLLTEFPDCSLDGELACISTANFPVVDKNNKLSPANMTKVKSSLTIAGIPGTMVDCAADGDTVYGPRQRYYGP